MDERLRLLERTDRRRYLIERHRAGLELVYEVGDIVKIINWKSWYGASEEDKVADRKYIVGRTGVICALSGQPRVENDSATCSRWIDVKLEERVFPVGNPFYGSKFMWRDEFTVPCEPSNLEPA